MFEDGGWGRGRRASGGLWGEGVGSKHRGPGPPKTQLQEWAQARGLALPVYRQVGREGSEHEPVFLVEVKVGTQPAAQGRGQTKRDAESAAPSAPPQQLPNHTPPHLRAPDSPPSRPAPMQ